MGGFLVGWMLVVVRIATWGALANAFVTGVGALMPTAADYRTPLLIVLFVAIALVHCAGIRQSALATNIFTVAKLLPMLVFIGVGVFFIDPQLFRPFAPHGYGEVGAGTLVILFAFVGFELLGIPAGEMKQPRRDMPRALLVSMSLITALYLGIWAVCAGTLPTLAGSETPVSDAAAVFLGSSGGVLISVGILMSVIGVNFATSLSASRSLFALGEQGVVPRIFGRAHAKPVRRYLPSWSPQHSLSPWPSPAVSCNWPCCRSSADSPSSSRLVSPSSFCGATSKSRRAFRSRLAPSCPSCHSPSASGC